MQISSIEKFERKHLRLRYFLLEHPHRNQTCFQAKDNMPQQEDRREKESVLSKNISNKKQKLSQLKK